MTIGNRRTLFLLLSLAVPLVACGGGSGGGGAAAPGGFSLALGVAADAGGSVYFAGRMNGRLGDDYSQGGDDIFVGKNGPAGTNQWLRVSGTPSDDMAQSVAVDNNGNVYVAGNSYYNPNPLLLTNNVLLVKYDRDGNELWSVILEQYGDGEAHAVAADNAGCVYVAGSTYGSVDGDPNAGGQDAFVLKVSGAGTVLWGRQLRTPATDYATGVSVDGGGNVYVAGTTYGALDNNASAGDGDLFVAKFDGSGNKQWTRQRGTSQRDSAAGACTDPAGNVIAAGHTYGGLDGNGNAGNIDLFVVKYDPAGNWLWTRQRGTPTWDYANAVAADGAGNIYVGGQSYGGLDGNTNRGSWDLILLKFDAAGTWLWTREYGGGADDSANAVAADGLGNVYAAGGTGGTTYLVVKYDQSGNRL